MISSFFKTSRRLIALTLTVLLSSIPALAGLTIAGSNGITASGADGIGYVGTNGITASGADSILAFTPNGITASGADGITATGADGIIFSITPNAVTISGVNGITASGADGITISGADSFVQTGTNAVMAALNDATNRVGLQSFDPELAILLNRMTDDSNVDAVIVYYQVPTDADIADLQRLGVLGGTRYRALQMIAVTTTTVKR